MASRFQNVAILPFGEYHNYDIAGNICNAFVLGEVGANDDFYLVGVDPGEETFYPLLTGNILDSEGKLLFQLARNNLVVNPGKCRTIRTTGQVGYEIYDSDNQFIFGVRTTAENIEGIGETNITRVRGRFFNKAGELVFETGTEKWQRFMATSVRERIRFRSRWVDLMQR